MKIREVLEKVNKTLECKSYREETVKNRIETRNYEGNTALEGSAPYVNQIDFQENVSKDRSQRAIPEEVVIGWIGQTDARIRCELLREDPANVVVPVWEEDELAVPDAYCSVYYYYCLAMSAITCGDSSDYNRFWVLYNEEFNAYARSIVRNR